MSMAHECLKSSLAFRKPAVPGRCQLVPPGHKQGLTDGPKVGLDGPASLGAGRSPWCAGHSLGYLYARGGKAMFVAAADLSMLPMVPP